LRRRRTRCLPGTQYWCPGDAAAAAATLNRCTVEYAEPNVELHALATPNDPRFGDLYGLNNANDADMDAPAGWNAGGLSAAVRFRPREPAEGPDLT
jgi:hypothetical protein